jgi:hypothetical protein
MSGAAFFFAISWAKPTRRLAAERPPRRVLNARLLLSVVVQVLSHLAAVIAVARLCG